jgi:hypothetical protein
MCSLLISANDANLLCSHLYALNRLTGNYQKVNKIHIRRAKKLRMPNGSKEYSMKPDQNALRIRWRFEKE